jgi:hypothetical protein
MFWGKALSNPLYSHLHSARAVFYTAALWYEKNVLADLEIPYPEDHLETTYH